MTWVLLLFVVHYEGLSLTQVKGFASADECAQVGRAWLAQANKREGQTDVTFFRCKPAY